MSGQSHAASEQAEIEQLFTLIEQGLVPLSLPMKGYQTDMFKLALAVVTNCVTMLISLFLTLLAWAGMGMGKADGVSIGMKVEPLATKDVLEAFMYVVGFFAIATTPSWVLIFFKKPRAALTASAIPLIFGLSVMYILRYGFM